MKTTKKYNIFTHKTISYFKAIVKANRPINFRNNRLDMSNLCDTVKSKNDEAHTFRDLLLWPFHRSSTYISHLIQYLSFTLALLA